MLHSRPTFSLLGLLTTLSFGAGCDHYATDPIDDATWTERSGDDGDDDDDSRGTWINNGLVDPDVTGIDPLSTIEDMLQDEVLLADPERQDTMRYLVECALPEDYEATVVVAGETLEFHGILGLAPEWETGECDEDCQEWVSACLLSRTNVSGQTVTIRMQADHPAIGTESSLVYSAYEASFFGNLFASQSSENYCQGNVVGPALAQLQGRTCSNVAGESCDFTVYTECELEERCQWDSVALGLLGPLGAPTATGCMTGPLPGDHAYHTISTYVAPL